MHPLSQLRQRWDDNMHMLHMQMCYGDVSGFNLFRISSNGDSASVKFLRSFAQPVIKGGTVSHVWTVIYCSALVSLGHIEYIEWTVTSAVRVTGTAADSSGV
jgi:hypothetical protein